MNENITTIEDAVASLLSSLDIDSIKRSVIVEKVEAVAAVQGECTNKDIQIITRKLEERFDISMTLGTLFAADYRPWLDNERGDINWYYWNRYKRFLDKQKFPPKVIRSLDSITDTILDHLENPEKDGKWSRKGMVVGHVQSGKTANYIGVVNKAADSGYKVIIILAGMLNSLRNQTQSRLDSGFIGINTESKQKEGVGFFSNEKNPVYFTTNIKDFKKNIVNSLGVSINQITDTVVLVIKKNKSTLDNLIDWLKHNNPHNLKNFPMLLVDDEADHASINTSKEGTTATTINLKIRQLLHLFERSSYLGYTATPFANVFIDPETDNEDFGDDLFPRDFIVSLDPPSNYVGAARVFSSERDLDIVRIVNDYEDKLPLKHKKDHQLEDLPDSLKEAIEVFILIRAIRLLRSQSKSHNSMLVNISRFTAVQSNVKLLVDEYLKEVRQSIFNSYKLNLTEALKSSHIASLKIIFDREYYQIDNTWAEVQSVLKSAVSSIGVIEVNSSSSAELLDYSYQNYPQGRNVIAIGGISLSRGLTLEGLSVSYFLRNSIMYDTLMQMGRWFGYRNGFAELCRIYMTAEAESWYTHISDVTDELRNEFKRMKAAGMSPKDFGLCIRSHPESLIVTARNKMRSGIPITRKVSLEGRLVETKVLLRQTDVLEANRYLFSLIIKDMLMVKYPISRLDVNNNLRIPSGYLWKDIPISIIKSFIKNFRNHPASQLTDQNLLISYINNLEDSGINYWDVILISPNKKGRKDKTIDGLVINTQKRTVSKFGEVGIAINKEKRRVGYAVQESAGLPEIQLKHVETKYKNNNLNKLSIPGSVYRKLRGDINGQPLLILHLLDCMEEKDKSLFSEGAVAYGVSFPGEAGNHRPQKLVEYIVNTIYWENEFSYLLDEEEDEEND